MFLMVGVFFAVLALLLVVFGTDKGQSAALGCAGAVYAIAVVAVAAGMLFFAFACAAVMLP